MPSPESLQAFVLAAELGSFSAAARKMNKAQSAVSTAIANLEIDTDLQLFDRSSRSPTLTQAGKSLLPYAKGVLLGNQEFFAKATSMAEGVEDNLCIAIEQGINLMPVLDVLCAFSEEFPDVSLEVLTTGPNDTAALLKEGRAILGLMTEQESYPAGFQFRGVGHSALIPVCSASHPLANLERVAHRDLRQYRQLVLRSRSLDVPVQVGEIKSASIWYAENPHMIVDLVLRGMGWAELPFPVVRELVRSNKLAQIKYTFQQSDALEGIDLVWTEQRVLGQAGQWIQSQLLNFSQDVWQG
ncbi:LysR family transcriptional regulator [Roseovarius aestuarii]|uniref:HTH-type transcriptional activator AllS n=1 Tax=Roseovarius aestuarii TaxID=475083 RepID=A0A1X7BX80_9RHOB|nr:LysR family transcriptional regulator [Roseovarius aestuarii]SMC14100.1 HTH-type transcriptional activator AllS [Roseovarius aestuarii]